MGWENKSVPFFVVLKDTFSSDSLKNAAIAGATAGFTQGVIDPQFGGNTTPFNNLTKGFDLQTLQGIGGFALHAGVQGIAAGAIKTAISGGSLGENLKDGLVTQAGNVVAATAFNFVGGYAQDHWQAAKDAGDTAGMAMWAEGGVARTAMHALMGGAVSSATGGDFKTGAIAAGASQAMAGVLNDTFDKQPGLRQAFSQIVGLSAAGLAGGDVTKASWVAQMADEYNRQLHQKETVALEKLQKDDPDNAYQLKAAACALVHCSASVPPEDPFYKNVKQLELDGAGFKDAQSKLFATGSFDEYSSWDKANDDLLQNDEAVRRTGSARRAVVGAVFAAAGFGGAVAGTPACVTGVGCAIPIISGVGGLASFHDGWQATGQLFAPYGYAQGSNVLASFDSATYPGDVNPMRDYGAEAAKAALEMALLKGAGKYLDGTGASVLVKDVKGQFSPGTPERLVYLSNSTAPEMRSGLVSAIKDIRQDLPLGGNAAFAEVKIDALSSEAMVMKSFSQYDARVGEFLPKPPGDMQSWILQPQSATSKYIGTPEAYLRDMDTEFKILETVAQRLGDNKGAVGQINLVSEKSVCPSCTDVIRQFRERYPKIQLNVFTVEN